MKNAITLLFVSLCFIATAQTSYESSMTKALGDLQQGKSEQAKSEFQKIALSDKQNWIPAYYFVFLEITNGFSNPNKEEVLTIVERNKKEIEKWIITENDEWYVLRAFNSTLEVTTDPMNKGYLLYNSINQDYKIALEINPKNPRAQYQMASFNLRSAAYTGVDASSYCQTLQGAIKLFDSRTSSDIPFYPSWGKSFAEKELTSLCTK